MSDERHTSMDTAAPWRGHPKLIGRFNLEHPDDVPVLVHDGGPRVTDRRAELIWIRITGGCAPSGPRHYTRETFAKLHSRNVRETTPAKRSRHEAHS